MNVDTDLSDGDGCGKSVKRLYYAAMAEANGNAVKAVEVLVKTMLVLALAQSKTGYERRTLVETQKVANTFFDGGIEALDEGLRRMAFGE